MIDERSLSRDEYRIWICIRTHRGQDTAINQHEIFQQVFPRLLQTLSSQGIKTAKIRMRKGIRTLRDKSFPILSVPGKMGGYYLPADDTEVKNWREFMKAKAYSELAVVNPVIRGCNELLRENVRQLELDF